MRKKMLFLLFSLSISSSIFSQGKTTEDTTLIIWSSERQISWTNFSGEVSENSSFKAECTTFFRSNFETRNDSVFCTIRAFFDRNKSWKKNVILNNTYDLNHEQIHFDITELFARKIRQEIRLNNLNEQTLQKRFGEIVKECDDFQKLYDIETNHSIDTQKQNEWTKKVKNLLESLNLFKEQPMYIKNPICRACWK